jgi:multiple sugar transport system substrate-binding protein
VSLVRTIVLTIMGAVAVFVLLFGGRRVETPQNRVVVSYWEKWTGKEADQMKEIVNDFNNTVGKEKGIYVQYLSMSSVNQKTLVATAAGVPPDIAGLWDPQVTQFAAIDALEPLDELAAQHGITPDYYKPVYWKGCTYKGRLWALVSTPAAVALHYNKELFQKKEKPLRAAGLDPNRPPQTLKELDRYAEILDDVDVKNGKKSIAVSGYLPMEPGWFLSYTTYWFGGKIFDQETQKLNLTDPKMVQAFEWVQSYSKRLGKDSMTEFRSGFGSFNSAQNPFLSGTIAMEQQGPWMANYIENLAPQMNRWKMSKEEERKLPREARKANYKWGAAPFPPADPKLEGTTYCGFDTLMIPRGARHKKEAFEFIAYVQRQDVMEKLNSLHCKNSPLAKVSKKFLDNHPNPYIDVFEKLASSPNAKGVPPIPIWPEVGDELSNVAQRVYLLEAEPKQALAEAQARLQMKWDDYRYRQKLRGNDLSAVTKTSGYRWGQASAPAVRRSLTSNVEVPLRATAGIRPLRGHPARLHHSSFGGGA